MEEQLDDNVSIYCGTTNDDILVSYGNEWNNEKKLFLQSISWQNDYVSLIVHKIY